MITRTTISLVAVTFFTTALLAQETTDESAKPAEDPAHQELRQLRDAIFGAYEKQDLDGMLSHVHKDAVITWQNAELNRGQDGLKDFYNRMMSGDNRIVESLTSKLTVEDLSILHGDNTAIAFGVLDDEYKLKDGTAFNLHSRWTATVVKESDRWLVASFHVSANMFDNPILDKISGLTLTIAVIAAIVGLIIGFIIKKILGKPAPPKSGATESE